MKSILVSGGNGQLGSCLKEESGSFSDIEFIFMDLPELDITNRNQLSKIFNEAKFSWCINCAAYTNVDKAETNKEVAYSVNQTGPYNLARTCKEHRVKLIHISTDFVFNGKSPIPYIENDSVSPLSIYGDSKLGGENKIITTFNEYYIIRTSWLYSEYGHNFLKTMLNLSNTRNELNIIFDQVGTPTYARDLATIILKIIIQNNDKFGIYHYSNEGVASWYDFAKTIFEETNKKVSTYPIKTIHYPRPAKRPHFSVLDKTKIKETFNIQIPYWRDSLKAAISKLK